MRKRSYHIALAGAALAALPSISHGVVTLTFGIDSASFLFSTTTTAASFTSTVPTGVSYNPGTNTLTLPSGYNFEFGVTADMVGGTDSGKTATGLAGFDFGISDGNSAYAQVDPFGSAVDSQVLETNGKLAFNSAFATTLGNGTPYSDGNGGVIAGNGIFADNTTPNETASFASNRTLAYGTAVDVVNTIQVDTVANTTSSPVNVALALTPDNLSDSFVYNSAGTYRTQTMGSADNVTMPTLNVVINGTASVNSSNHAIVSLTTSTPSGYGSQDGSLTLQPIAPGSYPVATDSTFTTATTAYVSVSGFDSGDTEIYALKLNVSGGTPTTAQLNQIISDITTGTTGGTAAAGVAASLVTGIYSTLFPGYNLLLTTTSGPNPADTDLAFDFSSTADSDSTLGPVTVAGVAAVPEPATAAGVVLGAAGLLLGRRRKLTSIA